MTSVALPTWRAVRGMARALPARVYLVAGASLPFVFFPLVMVSGSSSAAVARAVGLWLVPWSTGWGLSLGIRWLRWGRWLDTLPRGRASLVGLQLAAGIVTTVVVVAATAGASAHPAHAALVSRGTCAACLQFASVLAIASFGLGLSMGQLPVVAGAAYVLFGLVISVAREMPGEVDPSVVLGVAFSVGLLGWGVAIRATLAPRRRDGRLAAPSSRRPRNAAARHRARQVEHLEIRAALRRIPWPLVLPVGAGLALWTTAIPPHQPSLAPAMAVALLSLQAALLGVVVGRFAGGAWPGRPPGRYRALPSWCADRLAALALTVTVGGIGAAVAWLGGWPSIPITGSGGALLEVPAFLVLGQAVYEFAYEAAGPSPGAWRRHPLRRGFGVLVIVSATMGVPVALAAASPVSRMVTALLCAGIAGAGSLAIRRRALGGEDLA